MKVIDFSFKNICGIFLKAIILTSVFVSLSLLGFYLIHNNVNVAHYISDTLNIPRDLSLTVMSAGFSNNIIILMTVFEFGFGIYIVNKFTNTQFYDNIKNFIINL